MSCWHLILKFMTETDFFSRKVSMGLAFLCSILDCFHQRSFSSRPILEILLPIQSFAKTTLEANLVIWYVRIVNLFCTCLYMTNDSGTFGQFFGFPPLTSSSSPWTPLATTGLTPLKKKQCQHYHCIHYFQYESSRPPSSLGLPSHQHINMNDNITIIVSRREFAWYDSPLRRGSLGLPRKKNHHCQN